MKLKIFSAFVLILVCIQFIHNQRNESSENSNAIWVQYPTSEYVKNILKESCLDCHSNKTEYPWYADIQPIEFWLSRHINEGKKHLNFSEFKIYSINKQYHKLEENIEMIKEDKMPLKSYTYFGLHPKAKLSEEDKNSLIHWSMSIMDSMQKGYSKEQLSR